MKNRIRSFTAAILILTMVAACTSPHRPGSASQGNPCSPDQVTTSASPTTSFIKQAILNPLANIGGTLLATAAANYSQLYTGQLNKFLTRLVTPKGQRTQNPSGQDFFGANTQQGQPDYYNDFPQYGDPNTGIPDHTDPYTGYSMDDQHEFDMGGVPQDPYAEYGEGHPFEQHPIQEEFDPNAQELSGEVYPRGVRGQVPHATFSPEPCHPQTQGQPYPADYPQQQPYGYDPYAGQQGYPSHQDPQSHTQAYDPYYQQQEHHPYGQTYSSDPYGQQHYPQDPYASQSHPQDPYAQPSYPPETYHQPDTGIPIQETGARIGLDVVMVKKVTRNGATLLLPIKDGDVLKDGRGNPKAGDKFRIMFRPNMDGYVYIIAIDGSGWAQGIFPPPTSPLANPVKADQQYVIPENNNWFSLDQYRGIETIFFVASKERRQDIEDILQSITGRERPASETPRQVTKVAMVPNGVGGARPSADPFHLSTGSEQDHTIIPTSYLAKTAGEDLRLTRWFQHQ